MQISKIELRTVYCIPDIVILHQLVQRLQFFHLNLKKTAYAIIKIWNLPVMGKKSCLANSHSVVIEGGFERKILKDGIYLSPRRYWVIAQMLLKEINNTNNWFNWEANID